MLQILGRDAQRVNRRSTSGISAETGAVKFTRGTNEISIYKKALGL